MWPSTQRIGKDIRVVYSKADNVISEACFIAMTGDRHDELAAMDLSMIAVALTPSLFVWILKVMPVSLYFPSFLFLCFVLNTKLYTLYECWVCLILVTECKPTNLQTHTVHFVSL